MHHLDDDGDEHVRIAGLPGGSPAQRDQRRAHLLALIGERVFGVGGNVALEGVDLFLEPIRHGLKKRFRRGNDALPSQRLVRWRSHRVGINNRAGFGGQHLPEA
jgi:hypothetical protein